MTNKNLTDEDVVESLERCISTTTDKACTGCPFNKQNLCNIDQWVLERYAQDYLLCFLCGNMIFVVMGNKKGERNEKN